MGEGLQDHGKHPIQIRVRAAKDNVMVGLLAEACEPRKAVQQTQATCSCSCSCSPRMNMNMNMFMQSLFMFHPKQAIFVQNLAGPIYTISAKSTRH